MIEYREGDVLRPTRWSSVRGTSPVARL